MPLPQTSSSCPTPFASPRPSPLPQVGAMRKYAKQYEVAGVNPQTSSKEDLASAVTKHWNAWVRAVIGVCRSAVPDGFLCAGAILRTSAFSSAASDPAFPCLAQAITEENVLQNLLRVRGRH